MSSNLGSVPLGDKTADIVKAFQAEGQETAVEMINEARDSQEALRAEEKENTSYGAMIKSGKLKPPQKAKTEKAERAQESVLVRKEDADSLADEFTRREGNRQFRLDRDALGKILYSIGRQITSDSLPSDIIAYIRQNLTVGQEEPDVSQIDKTFEFLLEVLKSKIDSTKTPEIRAEFERMHARILEAKNQHYEANRTNIDLARKLINVADALMENSERGAPETIAHVRDIVNNPQDLSSKFKYYKSKGYSFKEMKQEIDSILTFVGSKFKQTDILPGEMSRLMDETRTLQAILQIFRHFKRSMPLVYTQFTRNSIPVGSQINYESLSTTFMKLVDERYPSAEKINQFASSLADQGLSDEHIRTIMLIILLSIIRDAIREVAPNRVYRSLQHRDDLYLAIIEALEDLEDALEEMEEEEEETQ